ncbi:MAG: tRNA-wybutosine modification methyltransferase TYW3, partial [Nanoarchaeota archaeon]
MDFDRKKESILSKMREADRSKKGGIDDDIRDVLDMLNKHPDYATTSSCSGRIVLLDLRERRKDVNEWLLSKHAPVTEIEWNTAMEKEKKGIVWLKQEPSILHVSCR